MKTLFVLLCSLLSVSMTAQDYVPDKRMRVIIDNDFGGDPDGLFQLAHHLLSPSIEICGIIGSHLTPEAGFDNQGNSAEKACQKAHELMKLMGMEQAARVVAGAATGITDLHTPQVSDGARLIVEEAMRNDDRPLYVVCGAGLTNIASAWLMQPEIAKRLTLVWIGGQEYGRNDVPCEYNMNLCIKAGQVVFNESDLQIWQIPANVYRQCIFSLAELRTKVKPCGAVGEYLVKETEGLMTGIRQWTKMGEIYILGDSPLVLLTALQTGWAPEPASSFSITRPIPTIGDNGLYIQNDNGRPIRVFTQLDNRLLFEDMIAKFKQYEK